MIQTQEEKIAAAFTEWDRRWREDPDGFESDAARVLKGRTPTDYGTSVAPYFLELLNFVSVRDAG